MQIMEMDDVGPAGDEIVEPARSRIVEILDSHPILYPAPGFAQRLYSARQSDPGVFGAAQS